MKLDIVFHEIYGNGAFHILLVLLTSMNGILVAFDLHLNVFMLYRPENVTCIPSHKLSANLNLINKCSYNANNSTKERIECNEFSYSHDVMTDNILMEHNLVCERAHFGTWLRVIYLSSIPLGYFVSMNSDWLGRKFVYLALTLLQTVVNFMIIALHENLVILFVLMFLRGSTLCLPFLGSNQVAELLPIEKRAVYVVLINLAWCVGNTLCPVVAYFLRDWILIKYVSVFCAVTHPLLFYIFPTSPRLMILHGKKQKALYVFKRIIKYNKPILPDGYIDHLEEEIDHIKTDLSSKVYEDTLLRGLQNATILKHVIIYTICHTLLTFCYFGLLSDSHFISSDLYLGEILAGAVEIPSAVIPWLMCDKFGRRWTILLLRFLCAVTMLATICSHSYEIVRVISGTVARFALFASYALADLYVIEIFPTSIRSSCSFLTMTLAAIISSFSPIFNSSLHGTVAYICYAIGVGISGLLMFVYLPETKGYPLPETIESSQSFVRGNEEEWAQSMKNIASSMKI